VRAYAPGSPGTPDARLSYGTTLHLGWAIVIGLTLGALALIYFFAASATLPWYQRKVKESYSGRLPPMPGEAGAEPTE